MPICSRLRRGRSTQCGAREEHMRLLSWRVVRYRLALVSLLIVVSLQLFPLMGLQSIDEDDDILSAMARGWSKRMASAKPPTPSGERSTENIKNCFRRILAVRMKRHPSKCRAFCKKLSLTRRVLLKRPWTPRPSSSSDSDPNRCQVRGGADDHLSLNRRHSSVSAELKQPNVT